MLDIVVPLFNDAGTSARCLTHLKAFMPHGAHLTLIDNASTDWTPALCREFEDRHVTVIRNEKNLGVYAALNQGIKAAEWRQVLLLNSDVMVGPNTCIDLLEAAKRFDALCISPREIVPPAPYGDLFQDGAPPRDEFPYQQGAGGAAQLHDRELYEVLGLFDEKFFLTYGDADFTERMMQKAGDKPDRRFVPIRLPTVVVYHEGQSSRRANHDIEHDTALEIDDQRHFHAKWADCPDVIARHPLTTAEILTQTKRKRWH